MKIFLIIFVILLMLPNANGELGFTEEVKVDTDFDLTIHVFNATTGIDILGGSCVLNIFFANHSPFITDGAFTEQTRGQYNNTFSFPETGIFHSTFNCTSAGAGSAGSLDFIVVGQTLREKLDSILNTLSTLVSDIWNNVIRTITSFPFEVGLNQTAINDISQERNVSHGVGVYNGSNIVTGSGNLTGIEDSLDEILEFGHPA